MQKSVLLAGVLSCLLMAACGGGQSARPEAAVERDPASYQDNLVVDQRQRAKVHTDLGIAYLQDGRLETALEEAEIALDAWRGYAPAHNLKGLLFMAMRQNEQAEASFRRALQLAPDNPVINNDYGWFLCQTGRIKESFTYFNKALNNPLYQNPSHALHNLGVCSIRDKDDINGETYLFRSLKHDPNNWRAYYLLADIGYRNKRYEDAREWLVKLHDKIEPTAESAWLALKVERKLGNRDNEARYVGILRRKYRDTPEYQQMLRGEFD